MKLEMAELLPHSPSQFLGLRKCVCVWAGGGGGGGGGGAGGGR